MDEAGCRYGCCRRTDDMLVPFQARLKIPTQALTQRCNGKKTSIVNQPVNVAEIQEENIDSGSCALHDTG